MLDQFGTMALIKRSFISFSFCPGFLLLLGVFLLSDGDDDGDDGDDDDDGDDETDCPPPGGPQLISLHSGGLPVHCLRSS